MHSLNPIPHGGKSIVDVALEVGIKLTQRGDKFTCRCPLHDDGHASAVIFVEQQVFFCSVCGGFGKKRFQERLGILDRRLDAPRARPRIRQRAKSTFAEGNAQRAWDWLRIQEVDDAVLGYLRRRELETAIPGEHFAGLPVAGDAPRALRWFRRGDYRLVVPLYKVITGELSNLQARSIRQDVRTRVIAPKGSRLSGAAFLNDLGHDVIVGCESELPIILAEGLADHLTLSICARGPVVSAPGTSVARHVIGPWVRDRHIVLAFDHDSAGRTATRACGELVLRRRGEPFELTWPCGASDANEALVRLGREDFTAWIEREVYRV